MPRICKVDHLLPEQRAALDAEIERRGFGDFEGLAQWTREQGFPLSRSLLHRYARPLRVSIRAARRLFPIGSRLPGSPDVRAALQELGALEIRRVELVAIVQAAMAAEVLTERQS